MRHHGRARRHGKQDLERCTLINFTVYLNGTPMAADNTQNGRQSQPPSQELGGEKGIKNPVPVFGGNTTPRVGNLDVHVITLWKGFADEGS